MERKQQKGIDKLEMRERILSEAMTLFVEYGLEKTSIRKIAQAVGCSPGTIYLYFKDKDEILIALRVKGFMGFKARFDQVAFVEKPLERIRFFGRNYMDFGLKNPEMYHLMFSVTANQDIEDKEEVWALGRGAFQHLEETVKECLREGVIKQGDYRHISYTFWSHVHGLVSLAHSHRLKMFEGDPETLMIGSLNYMVDSMRI